MHFAPAALEEWMRRYYFDCPIDIGSSGVESFSVRQLRELLGISLDELDNVTLCDSTTLGSVGLRESIARRWGRGDPDGVMVTHGSSEAIFLVMNTMLEPGDEVVALEPIYHSLTSIARTIGCRVIPWRLQDAHGFEPEVDDVRRLISRRTSMVVVNFPHNPTGVTLTSAQQERLMAAIADAGAYLVWDAAFSDLVHDGPILPDPTRVYDRAISVGTLSKAYGLPGLRFGWCLAAPEVISGLLPLRDRSTLHLSPLIELLARRAIEQAGVLLADRLRQARRNLAVLDDWAAGQEEHLEWRRPAGGVSAFPRFRELRDVEPLCHGLAREHGVLLIPGACFGYPDRARVGFGGSTQALRKGLAHLADAIGRDCGCTMGTSDGSAVPGR